MTFDRNRFSSFPAAWPIQAAGPRLRAAVVAALAAGAILPAGCANSGSFGSFGSSGGAFEAASTAHPAVPAALSTDPRGDEASPAARGRVAGTMTAAPTAVSSPAAAGASPFGVTRVPANAAQGGGSGPAGQGRGETRQPGGAGLQGQPAGAFWEPSNPMLEQLARTPLSLALATERLLDALLDSASARIGKDLQRPNGVVVWPMRELLSQRRTVSTATARRQALAHLADEYRGLSIGTPQDWAAGRTDWAVVAGLQWRRLESAGDEGRRAIRGTPQPVTAELCGVLFDRRSEWPVARFVQRVDPASLNLTPTSFFLDLPLIPRAFQLGAGASEATALAAPTVLAQAGTARTGPTSLPTSRSLRAGVKAASTAVVGPWICDPSMPVYDAATGTPVVTPLTTATLSQGLFLEQGIEHYETRDYGAAAEAFSKAIDSGSANVEVLVAWAMASDRLNPRSAGAAWDRLADALLDEGALTLVSVPARMASQGRRLAAAVANDEPASPQLRRVVVRRAASLGPNPGPARMWLQLTASLAARLNSRGQCAAVVAHQDLRERNTVDRAPAFERAQLLTEWMTASGRLGPSALRIEEARGDMPIVGTASSDLRDAWNRRLDLTLTRCDAPAEVQGMPTRNEPRPTMRLSAGTP